MLVFCHDARTPQLWSCAPLDQLETLWPDALSSTPQASKLARPDGALHSEQKLPEGHVHTTIYVWII